LQPVFKLVAVGIEEVDIGLLVLLHELVMRRRVGDAGYRIS
jgi:hypothetical protein